VICRTWSFKVRPDVQLLAWFVVGTFLFLQIFLPDLAFGWSSRNGGVGYEATSTGMSHEFSCVLLEVDHHTSIRRGCCALVVLNNLYNAFLLYIKLLCKTSLC
jgi:hypothetical protein